MKISDGEQQEQILLVMKFVHDYIIARDNVNVYANIFHEWLWKMALKTPGYFYNVYVEDLSSLSSDSASQLDILGHDGHTLRVNGSQVGIL